MLDCPQLVYQIHFQFDRKTHKHETMNRGNVTFLLMGLSTCRSYLSNFKYNWNTCSLCWLQCIYILLIKCLQNKTEFQFLFNAMAIKMFIKTHIELGDGSKITNLFWFHKYNDINLLNWVSLIASLDSI